MWTIPSYSICNLLTHQFESNHVQLYRNARYGGEVQFQAHGTNPKFQLNFFYQQETLGNTATRIVKYKRQLQAKVGYIPAIKKPSHKCNLKYFEVCQCFESLYSQ